MRCASQSRLDWIAAKRGSRSRRRLFHLAELDATPEFSSGLMAQMRREPSSSADRTRSSLGTDGATSSGERPKRSSRAHRWVPATGGCRAEAGKSVRFAVAMEFNFVEARRERGAIGHSAIQTRRRSKCAGIFRPLRQDAARHRKLRRTARSWPPWRGRIRPSNPPSGTPSSLPRKRRTPCLRGVCRRRSGWRRSCAEHRNGSVPGQLHLHRTREVGSHPRDRSRTRPSRSGPHRLLPPAP
jgi:hypothetical protein